MTTRKATKATETQARGIRVFYDACPHADRTAGHPCHGCPHFSEACILGKALASSTDHNAATHAANAVKSNG